MKRSVAMSEISQLQQAKILFASGQVEESIELFDEAERAGCGKVDIWLSRGAAHMAIGRYNAALEDFSRVIDEDNDNERAYFFKGIAEAALGLYEAAVEDLTLSLVRNNKRGLAHLVRGLAYSELGQKQDAILDINTASAFSEAELKSFRQLFGNTASPFENTKALLAKENAPWNNLLPRGSIEKLRNIL